MNRDDIIRMARDAMAQTSIKPNDKVVFYISYGNGTDADGFCVSVHDFIERFAAKVAAVEREACLKAAEGEASGWHGDSNAYSAAMAIADGIRARGQE